MKFTLFIITVIILITGCTYDLPDLPPPPWEFPPNAPTNLRAERTGETEITLTWQDNSDYTEEVLVEESLNDSSNVTRRIKYKGDRETATVQIAETGTHYYRVQAVNDNGGSAFSNNVRIDIGVPNAPTNLRAERTGETEITLMWEDNDERERGFEVEESVAEKNNFQTIGTPSVNLTSLILTDRPSLAEATFYYYRIRAFNDIGFSNYSNIAFTNEMIFPLGDTGESIIMVWIPSGSFDMGSPDGEQDRGADEGPVHLVSIPYGFWMSKYKVAQKQWLRVMGSNPAHGRGVGDSKPIYNISWNDVQIFESRLNNRFRLPTEAEWEYACRAGSNTRCYWGNDLDYQDIDAYAIYRYNSNNQTANVGTKLPNAWNLYDMIGNVDEWCEDYYHSSYNGAPNDGRAWLEPSGLNKILRSGSWGGLPEGCRSANRIIGGQDDFYDSVGFRLVRDAE